MASKRFTGIRLDEDLLAGLEQLREAYGAPLSESIRRAVREYLERKGVIEKTERKRAGNLKRP